MNLSDYDREFNQLALLDEEFLIALQEQKEREVYARITALDVNELPLEYIEGTVQSGNINVDGNAAIRRTCSLTIVAETLNIRDVYWGVKTKVKIEIGLNNNVHNSYDINGNKYPKIIWFPQGIFVLTNFNTSIQLKGYSISLQGKDKMCLLNGDLSGNLFGSVDFGSEEEEIKKFSPVTITDATSELLIAHTYYTEVNVYDYPEEVQIITPSSDMEYAFEEDEDGNYYKLNGFYHLITSHDVPANFAPQKYKIYKKVVKPSELFEEVSVDASSYEAGKYYYKSSGENNEFYTLDERSSYSRVQYYELKTLYRLEYSILKIKMPLQKIIRKAITTFAKEPHHNVIINDLDDYGLEQLTYKGDTPLLAVRRDGDKEFSNLAFKDRVRYQYQVNGAGSYKTLNEDSTFDELKETDWFKPDLLSNLLPQSPTPFYDNAGHKCYLAEISFGDDIGYRITDLTYTGDLITNLGDSLTAMLDKIKDMLGEFEYFYDLQGRFVFQQKKNFVNIAWTQIVDNGDEEYVTFGNDASKFSFNFENNRLITAIQNAPQLNNVRNDFSVWGKRKGINGNEIPIHARYAIDHKPTEYRAFNGILYYTEEAINNPSPEYLQIVNSDIPEEYVKNTAIIPNYLKDDQGNSDWWELMDWAEYYRTQTGVYPSYLLMEYCPQGFSGNIHFPPSATNSVGTRTLSKRILIDLEMTDSNPNHNIPYETVMINPDDTKWLRWSPFQHSQNGCGHTYAQYLDWYAKNPKLRTFIYKPKLPRLEVIEYDGGNPDYSEVNYKNSLEVDWRELIYRMALDYFAGQGSLENPIYDKNHELVLNDPDKFLSAVAKRNPHFFPTGYTGYEQYYSDMEGFWRQLYNPDYQPQPVWSPGHYTTERVQNENSIYYKKERVWNDAEITDFNIEYYFCPTENPIVNKQYKKYFTNVDALYKDNKELKNKYTKYLIKAKGEDDNFHWRYWNVNVINFPETLNFWIDFLDDAYELANFSVPTIGDRIKTVNEDKVRAIAYKNIPNLIVVSRDNADEEQGTWEQYAGPIIDQIKSESGYNFVWLPRGLSRFFNISFRGLSAKDKIEELLYDYSYCIENITITALPVYNLEPNTRIYVRDDTTAINGEYIIQRITLPLDHKGLMTISATKAPSRII